MSPLKTEKYSSKFHSVKSTDSVNEKEDSDRDSSAEFIFAKSPKRFNRHVQLDMTSRSERLDTEASTLNYQAKKINITEKDPNQIYKARGNLYSKLNNLTQMYEVIEEYWDSTENCLKNEIITTLYHETYVIPPTDKSGQQFYVFEEFIKNSNNENSYEIRRPIKGDVYIIQNFRNGMQLVDRTKLSNELNDSLIVGTLKVVSISLLHHEKNISCDIKQGIKEHEYLVEEYIDKNSLPCTRPIRGELEIYLKTSGEMGLREKIWDEENFKNSFTYISGKIKAVGFIKKIMVDQFQDEFSKKNVRREISGVLTESEFHKEERIQKSNF